MSNDILRILELAERLGNLAEAHLKTVAATHSLLPVHARILLYLANANRYSNTPQAVSDYLGLTKGTVSQSLILLESKGFLARGADDRDGRVVRLALTEAGLSLVKAVEQAGAERFQTAARSLPKGLLDGLTGMLRRLQLAEGRKSFGVCRTCRHHLAEGLGQWRCGLTGETLTVGDRERICREHEPAGDPA
ncbi:MAG: MarR family transcriptional regulator [Thiobacillus sp.]|nr:MarR family transcriptional regulator [Thiobacillus sp.]